MLIKAVRAAAVMAALAVAAAPVSSADPQPTLGRVWASNQEGYGAVRPAKVFNGGDPTGMIWNISWSSWGDEQARGTGTANWEAPGASVADSTPQPATIVAYNLGTCNGQLMYQAAKWFFPTKGETFNPAGHYNICTGSFVNGA